MSEPLAILGGPKAVTIQGVERWKRPIERELALIKTLLEEGNLSGEGSGFPKQFEDTFREFIGAPYCLLTDHGTTALASAYYAVGVGPGDEVITPVAGFICSFAGALHLGARPVFADVDPETLLVDPQEVERKITPRTRAINIVHLGGNLCDMDAFLDIGKRYGIPIVEDAAHAAGAEWDGKKIGSFGDITCFSMQGVNPNGKPIAGGEGGMVTTGNREFYERQLIYCHLHRAGIVSELTLPPYRMFDEQVLGLKFRAHPLALAVAMASFETLPYRIEKSNEYREALFQALREIPGLAPEKSYPKAKRISLYGGLKIRYQAEALDGLPIEKFIAAVRAEGVPISDPGWKHAGSTQQLQHLKPLFARGFDLWGRNRGPLGNDYCPPRKGDFPNAEHADASFFTLPSLIDPEEGLLEQWVTAFQKVVSHRHLLF
jgi:perosamine synthetase